jgi:hypothetical protein
MRLLKLSRLWLLWVVLLVLVLAALLGGPLGLWGGGKTGAGTGGADRASGGNQAGNVDRALGRCTAVEEALAGDHLGRAFDLLQLGERAGVPAAVQERWSQARRRADVALTRALRQLVAEVRGGRILAARSRLTRLTDTGNSRVTERLVVVGREERWPPLPGPVHGAKPDAEVVAVAKDLDRHRRVRVAHRGGVVDVPVWQAQGGSVTVRVQDEGGVAFPVFDRAAVEPVDPSFSEAVDQARICHRAGEVMVAWLWLCHCVGRSEAGRHEKELAALRHLLR